MICLKLKGGLGNQMFQYAIARIIAKKNNSYLLIDESFFQKTNKSPRHTPRNFELSVFKISRIKAKESDLLYFNQLSTINKLKREFGLNYPKIYNETAFNYNNKLLSIKKPVYLSGYFQSYKYFFGHENYIKSIFSFQFDQLGSFNKELLLSITNSLSISIHIRRGDYINNKSTQKFHGNCSMKYYLEAISILASEFNNFQLVFFSDDTDWVKDQFKDFPYSKIFVDHNIGADSWKDMFLMSSCKHNVIANSSFSWWAAWLNDNPGKRVIAPKHWFAKPEQEINARDLIPPEWIRI